jgi:hypothetical protein
MSMVDEADAEKPAQSNGEQLTRSTTTTMTTAGDDRADGERDEADENY